MNVAIEHLADHPEVIPIIADWYEAEWRPYYGPDGPGDARADLESRCRRDRVPYGLVALVDDEVCGTAALDVDASTGLSPSVVGLLVGPAHRGKGIGGKLVLAAEIAARDLGYPTIYMSTTVLGALLEKNGWRAMGDVEFLNAERGTVYVREL